MGLFNILLSKSKIIEQPSKEDVDYIVFDLETTGLSTRTCEIIEISALKVKGTTIVSTYSTLVRPECPVSPQASRVNHITNSMLSKERSIEQCLPEFMSYISDHVLLGYNIATYDIPILKRVCESFGASLENDYIDVLTLARNKLPFLPSRTLSSVSAYFGIDSSGAHRALTDCELTKECYERIRILPTPVPVKETSHKSHKTKCAKQTAALQELHALLLGITADNILSEGEVTFLVSWLNNNTEFQNQYPFNKIICAINDALEDGILEQYELDNLLSLFKKYLHPISKKSSSEIIISERTFCLTGDFQFGTKDAVASLIEQRGGIVKSGVSGKVDYVVIGSLGSADWAYGNYGSKVLKALELQDKGKNILIIHEDCCIKALSTI